MVLVAMQRLGASDERLAEFFAHYRDVNRLQPVPPPVAPIKREHWSAALGDRAREGDYRAYFAGEVEERLGGRAAIAAYLPTLLPGLAASATHGFMRLAYGVMRDDDDEIATALGYWAATYLELGKATGAPPVTDDPAEVLVRMRSVEAYRHIEPEARSPLALHARGGEAAGVSAAGRLACDRPGHIPARAASLALFAGTMDFCALHALTGCHWLRLLRPVDAGPRPSRSVISGRRSRRSIPRSASRTCRTRRRSMNGHAPDLTGQKSPPSPGARTARRI